MEIIQLSLIAAIFIIIAALMFLRKIPAIIALPLMAFAIPLVSGVNVKDILNYVIGAGATRLSEAYTIAFFGSMLSVQLQKTGVAENFIKIGAELSGDKPLIIAILMLLLIAMLFTTLGGLGAIIMVSTISLPILASIGLGPITIAGIFLIGISLGGIMNVGNWAVYTNVLKIEVDAVRSFALIMFLITFVAGVLYIIIQLIRDGIEISRRSYFFIGFSFLVIGASIVLFRYFSSAPFMTQLNQIRVLAQMIFSSAIIAFVCALFLWSMVRILVRKTGIWWGSYFIPVIPLLLILFLNMNFITAFIIGLIYGAISTYQKNTFSIFLKSVLEGGGIVMPAVVLMLGIGMLLNAMMGPSIALPQYSRGWPVLLLLKPVMLSILPKTPIAYCVFFSLFAPLALYRGALNVWGMGYGLAAIFLVGGLPAGAIMGLLLSVGQIQGISDPTNTQNVWLANELRVDVQKLLWNTLPYTWLLAILGIIIASLKFM